MEEGPVNGSLLRLNIDNLYKAVFDMSREVSETMLSRRPDGTPEVGNSASKFKVTTLANPAKAVPEMDWKLPPSIVMTASPVKAEKASSAISMSLQSKYRNDS